MYGDRNWGVGMITPIAQEHEEKPQITYRSGLKYYLDDLKSAVVFYKCVISPHFPSDFGPERMSPKLCP